MSPTLFESTARYYSRYRKGYPPALFDRLVERFELGPATPVMDLGCGTGQLAVPLRKRGVPVHAIDPDAEMLREGINAEAAAEVRGIGWYRGSDSIVGELVRPPVRLCTMGASFHWMDREEVLRTLDTVIDDRGGVAVVSGATSVWTVEPHERSSWTDVAHAVVVEFLGPERRAGETTYAHPKDRHEVVLGRSAFGVVDEWRFDVDESMTIDEIVGLQLSTSYASEAQLGDKLDAFCDTLRTRLTDLRPSGIFDGRTSITALVATR